MAQCGAQAVVSEPMITITSLVLLIGGGGALSDTLAIKFKESGITSLARCRTMADIAIIGTSWVSQCGAYVHRARSVRRIRSDTPRNKTLGHLLKILQARQLVGESHVAQYWGQAVDITR